MIDCLSRWCECVVVPDTTAETTTDAFIRQWICRYGVPKIVVSDKGPAFWSEVFDRCAALLGFSHIRTTARHPEGNAMIETFHRTLKKNISSIYLTNRNISFPTIVQLAAYSYRSTIHLTLGDSPAFITFGTDLRPPIENDWRFLRHPADVQRAKLLSEIRLQQIERAHAQFLLLSQLDQPGRTHDVFESGDIILVHLSDKELTTYSRNEHDRKITPKFSMPARVTKVWPHQKTAIVRHFGSGRTQEVHIQNARFLTLPSCPILRQQWIQLANTHAQSTITNPQLREAYLNGFWKDVHQPQHEVTVTSPNPSSTPPSASSSRSKRQRTEEQQFSGGECYAH